MQLFTPDDFLNGIPYLDPYKYKFLAQGDSWFSIGAIPPSATTNLLMELAPPASSCAATCARPAPRSSA